MRATNGLVVMAYGTPPSPDEVEAYYTHIRRGRPPSAEQLADLTARYEAIGGVSPLAERTGAQVTAIHDALDVADPGRWVAAVGNKHVRPFVEDAVAELAAQGVRRLVGLVLAPHYSRASVGEYHRRARATAAEAALVYLPVDSWHDEPAWLDAQAARVHDALAPLAGPNRRTSGPVLDENARQITGQPNRRTPGPVLDENARQITGQPNPPGAVEVVFTAHSLPERVLEGDPYADQLAASASAIADRAGLGGDGGPSWRLAWQSAGRTPEPWRGPDIAEVVAELGDDGRTQGIVVCPQGFVSDHLEVLYDLDIDARRRAEAAGLAFARTASINDDPTVMVALAARIRRAAASPADPVGRDG